MLFDDVLFMVYQYLEHAIGLEELEGWVLARLPLLFGSPDSAVADLAATIELGLAEIDDGLIEEKEFQQRLEAAIRVQETFTIFYPAESPIIVTGSCNKPLRGVIPSDWSEIKQTVEWVGR